MSSPCAHSVGLTIASYVCDVSKSVVIDNVLSSICDSSKGNTIDGSICASEIVHSCCISICKLAGNCVHCSVLRVLESHGHPDPICSIGPCRDVHIFKNHRRM